MYIFSPSRVEKPRGAASLTASPSLHFQLPLSMGFLRFSPIQNQCCSWSSDSLWATRSSSSTLSSYHITCHLVGCSHPPEGLVEELQDKVLLLRPADTQQVGSVPLTEQVSLKPSQLLLRLGGIKHLHTGDKGVSYSLNKLQYQYHFHCGSNTKFVSLSDCQHPSWVVFQPLLYSDSWALWTFPVPTLDCLINPPDHTCLSLVCSVGPSLSVRVWQKYVKGANRIKPKVYLRKL